MTSFSPLIHELVQNPAFRDYLPIVKGIRNAFVYGIKVRFPHALVMAILFGRGDWTSRVKHICRSCIEHATILAKAAGVYKLAMLLQRKTIKGKERSFETFVAGFLGGYVAFKGKSSICEQITLYIASRAFAALIPRALDSIPTSIPGSPLASFKSLPPGINYMQALTALSWGMAMWLFRHHSERLQPGLLSSIRYIYLESGI
ncbi:peroxisomal protein [Coprinopsis sp. MPI-PUGE-AT-0042]|nr:peroxisomal protein [Coprinopsis sp. MPI-PUGE-AT-0042]